MASDPAADDASRSLAELLGRLRQLDNPRLSENEIKALNHEIAAILARLGGLKRALDEERRKWPIQ